MRLEKAKKSGILNREGTVGDVAVGACLGHSNHEKMELLNLGEVRRGISRTATLVFRSTVQNSFGLFSHTEEIQQNHAEKKEGVSPKF